ncbi:MAG: NADPH-dependent F420 reductase [Acidobacteriaceae bacterium]
MPLDRPVIAILGGTGKEGTGLALRWAAAGYRVVIGSRSEDKAARVAEEINQRLGVKSVSGRENSSAAREADICVLTVVYSAHMEAVEAIKGALKGKIFVDATSRVDYRNPLPPEPPSAAEIAQQSLGPDVRVVAAFQNIPARLLAKGVGQKLEAEVLACSDDVQAAEQVIQLAEGAGMRGYYAGRLTNATIVEGLTCLLISLNKYYGIKDAGIMITGMTKNG